SNLRWELESHVSGTRLRLWHNIERRFISWGAAGWHICFDVLERLLAGEPIGRIVGAEAMKFGGWQRLNTGYAKQLGVEPPGWPPNGRKGCGVKERTPWNRPCRSRPPSPLGPRSTLSPSSIGSLQRSSACR